MDKEMFDTLFAEGLVILNSAAASRGEALVELAEKLRANNFVGPSFTPAVLKRENEFPTGLPTMPVGVAIPHTDIEHVIAPAIAVSILKNPIQFNEMGNPDNQVDVRIIFMLAVNTPHMQLDLLKQLISRVSDGSCLVALLHAQDERTVLQIMDAAPANCDEKAAVG